ncbi:sensor histidine kinase [Cohnella soli]|uniref:histidine kinase n=1 Tax=Cohnella soli TaxID=425005 RepID=A0ABW0HUS8_9BACL
MRANIAIRQAWRLVWQIVVSSVLALITFYLVLMLLWFMTRSSTYPRLFLQTLYNSVGQLPIIVLGCFVFFVFYMVLLNWRRFRYYDNLTRSVEHIAQGHFEALVPVRQNNEVTFLAENLNSLVEKLKRSLDEERLAEQTKNELITNVSHDLRTPLTSIIGYLGLIEQDRYRDEVELRYYVQIAYAKAERLKVLIHDLFEYTRMRHESQEVIKKPFNLVEMMNQLLAHHRLMLDGSKMKGELITDLTELRMMGEPDKLVRVFENLLANAVTYGYAGGKVDIYVNHYGGDAVVDFVNYGEAIPSSDLPLLFDRFYRVDKSRTENSGGSGLGLAIAKSIVERHGGSISATSDINATNFRVRLPIS